MGGRVVAPGRIVAVDHGQKRTGVAFSDRGLTFAFPGGVFEREAGVLEYIRRLHAESPVARIVVGMPFNMDGSIGPRAREVQAFCERLRAALGLDVATWDERLTSCQAEEMLAGTRARGRRGKAQVDVVAAQVILQSYLEHLAREARAGGGSGEG
ncbi:MAG TPA: Holliday junction resolvase RuvX [Planctomycetes bacterium]|nr:Holliday junction resolvase RuvX [Planctomycetota bacterium]